jgi:uncharacterized protein (TIGR02996 family)
MEKAFLQGMLEQPDDPVPRLVFADWLEEQGDPRGELIRLTHLLTQNPEVFDRSVQETRLRSLLAAGVQPVGPRWTNSLGMQFAWVSPGQFLMGSPFHEPERQEDETRHRVTLSRGFYLGVHPVTQAQWQAVMGTNPSRFQDPTRPVECVSWEDCQEFCQHLREADGLESGLPSPYRLATEAEWEFACRGGTTTPFSFGESISPKQANFHTSYRSETRPTDKARQETTPVGQFPSNAWGLADMHGNVYEWCADWYAPHPVTAVSDPTGPDKGNVRVLRGGSWHSLAGRCRSSSRGWGAPGYRGSDVGCRVCFRMDYCYAI